MVFESFVVMNLLIAIPLVLGNHRATTAKMSANERPWLKWRKVAKYGVSCKQRQSTENSQKRKSATLPRLGSRVRIPSPAPEFSRSREICNEPSPRRGGASPSPQSRADRRETPDLTAKRTSAFPIADTLYGAVATGASGLVGREIQRGDGDENEQQHCGEQCRYGGHQNGARRPFCNEFAGIVRARLF